MTLRVTRPLTLGLAMLWAATASATDAGVAPADAGPSSETAETAPKATNALPPQVVVDFAPLVERIAPSVATVVVEGVSGKSRGGGSGFFVHPDGWLATNAHVVSDASGAHVVLHDKSQRKVLGSLVVDKDHDVAVVLVEGYDAETKPAPALRLGKSTELKKGNPVVAYGAPKLLDGTFSQGTVSSFRKKGIPAHVIPGERTTSMKQSLVQHNASIAHGSSGSPLMRVDGTVVGINTFMLPGEQNLNFAVPVEQLQTHLDQLASQTPPKVHSLAHGKEGKPYLNLVISAVVFLALGIGWWALGRKRG